MCIIIDANLASEVFAIPAVDAFRPIVKWIDDRDGKMVFGGKNAAELLRIGNTARRIREWARQGKALAQPGPVVEEETRNVDREGRCVSDDPHVIALAHVSGARVLCSHDKDLHKDFTSLLTRPQGKVYQNESHKRLLKHTPGCPGYEKRR